MLQSLDAETLEERVRAVEALIERGEVPPREALDSPDPEVRLRAAEALEAIRWQALEHKLPSFLAAEEVPVEELRRLPFDEIRNLRVYQAGDHLVLLDASGATSLANPRTAFGQDFVIEALRDVRARSPAERRSLTRAAIRLLWALSGNEHLPPDEGYREDSAATTWLGGWSLSFNARGCLEGMWYWSRSLIRTVTN